MAIEYMVGFDCMPKRTLGVEGLHTRLKARHQAEAILVAAREGGDMRPPSAITIQRVRTEADGRQHVEEVSVEALLAAGRELTPQAPYCRQCPALVYAPPFGCYGAINYPIERATEEWLMRLLPADLDCCAGLFLTRAVADFDYDGAPVAGLREQGQTFFRVAEPVEVSWGEELQLTSDQLLHLLFFVGHVQPMHAFMAAMFLGLVPQDLEPRVLQDERARAAVLAEARIPDGDGSPQVEAFRAFFHALLSSARLGCDLLIDA